MKKLKKMTRIAGNYSGNAALCAILIMIMLLAIGSAALVVTGRTAMEQNANMPAATVVSSSEESSSEATESVAEEPKALMEYPEKDIEFQKVEIDNVSTKYSVLLDSDNNKIYAGRNYSKKIYPASLTKIMTVIVALENCDDLSDTYKFTKADIKSLADENASVAGFSAGEKVTVEDLLYGAMLPSGADATLGIANYVAGSEKDFVELMNAKVEELGLTGTHFTNASGLHDEDHYSTPIDIAMIVKYALDNDEIRDEFVKIISAESYTTTKSNKHEDGITLSSIFFERYDGFFIDRDEDGTADAEIIGGKTGFTDESGYSLASVYRMDDTYFVCVTVKSPTSGDATMDNVAVAEHYMPVYDLLAEDGDDSSSSSDSSADSSSSVDVTPKPIDQTESADMIATSSADSSSLTYTDEVPM